MTTTVTMNMDKFVTALFQSVLEAVIHFHPPVLNIKSRCRFMLCSIELPNGYEVGDIDISTVKISKIDDSQVEIFALPRLIGTGFDWRADEAKLFVKFSRIEIIESLDGKTGDVEFTVVGKVNESGFEGKDVIKVISRGFYWRGAEENEEVAVMDFRLHQNFPNPFNPETVIHYELLEMCHVLIEVYNIRGEKIRTLLDSEMSAGAYEVIWDGKDELSRTVPAGLYLCRMKAGSYQQTIRMLMVK
jgi:hypothetical protein